MQNNIRNTNLRFNLGKEQQRRAWEYLQTMDRQDFKSYSPDQMVDQIMALPERTKIQLLAPVVRGRKGRHEKVLEHPLSQV